MIPELRKEFNGRFNRKNYEDFLNDLDSIHPGQLDFRIAETPIFIPTDFKNKMLEACERIIDLVTSPDFKTKSANAIPPGLVVPNENSHTHFIAFDFGICLNDAGDYEPRLIEMQGFPSLLAYQAFFPELSRKYFPVPGNFDNYLGGYDKESYLQLLNETVIGDADPENVILLEIFPFEQKTRIDFFITQDYLGIKPVCLTELIQEGNLLYYKNENRKIRINRIYNRLIFDDLMSQEAEVREKGKIFFEELDVEWVPHPNWFYRISKHTLPLINHPYVPPTYYLDQLRDIPQDLENYVLKPLFSFAGQGVVIDVNKKDIDDVKDPGNWILQKKVKYADVIETPDIPAKAEIRLFYFWKENEARPKPANNLARLSKGKMVGVRYNKDKEWVGGSFCWFEKY